MDESNAVCIVFIFLLSSSCQSPQSSSFFGWPSNENEVSKFVTETSNIKSTFSSPINELKTASPEYLGSSLTSLNNEPSSLISSNISSLIGGNSSNSSFSNTTVQQNITSTLTSYFGAEISSYVTKTVVFLGAALGREGCDLKAACLIGTLVPSIQGRDIAMVAAEQLIPDGGNWKMLYQAAKSSMIQGQDCNQFSCV